MPIFLVILAMPFVILLWSIRYMLTIHKRRTEECLRQELLKATVEARVARPLKDYVSGLKTTSSSKIQFRVNIFNSPPTLGNIGRFAALSISNHSEQYFVQGEDGQVYGPATASTMDEWIREGRIAPETHVSNHANGPWLPARQIRAFQEVFREAVSSSLARNRFDNLRIQ